MANTLSQIESDVKVAQIVHLGEQLILPEGMSMDDGIKLLQRRKKYLEEELDLNETFNAFPLDGAYALDQVLTRIYGWSPAEATPSFFGSNPPKMISVNIDYDKVVQVSWGRFSLPNINGYIECSASRKNGRINFAISASVLRKDEDTVRKIFEEVRKELISNSIYKGKAIKIRFRDDSGKVIAMPEPTFMNALEVDENMLVYPKDTQTAIETSLFTPIQRIHDCIANGISVKRGVLLGGTFGTGKTMAAKVASKYAVQNGLTYIYVARADELADAIEFAKMYCDPAAVVFSEDIDRAMAGDNSGRTVAIDDILNIIDGIDTKSSNIITVLTTNDLENITPAMLRPGRLDAVIDVLPPDAQAAEKLVRLYADGAVSSDEDLTEVGQTLNGVIPAVIAEVVKRAKLSQLRLQAVGTKVTNISAQALLDASKSMKSQLDLLYRPDEVETPTIDGVLKGIVETSIADHVKSTLNQMDNRVEEIHNRVC